MERIDNESSSSEYISLYIESESVELIVEQASLVCVSGYVTKRKAYLRVPADVHYKIEIQPNKVGSGIDSIFQPIKRL